MTKAIVDTRDLHKHFGAVKALNGLDLQLQQGETLGLLGHNGAGKTTLIKLLLGILPPSSGHVTVFGQPPGDSDNKKRIGFLPENVSFYQHLSGGEVITYFARLKGHSKADGLALLQKVGLAAAANRKVKTYSKGMRQRLGLAQAFLGRPALLLLDEPTVGLDPIATAEFYQNIEALKHEGTSIILCSHVLSDIEPHIDKALILASGQQCAMGSLEQLRREAGLPVRIRAQGLNGSSSLQQELTPYYQSAGHFDVPPAQKLMVMRLLLSHADVTDVEVKQPSLIEMYQYFQQQTQPDGGQGHE